MDYFSLFTGIGGFELGIQQVYEKNKSFQRGTSNASSSKPNKPDINKCGTSNVRRGSLQPPTCVGYSEIDKYAIQIYEKHFNHKNYGDITKIKKLPDFELLVGGFPCQSFSIAGKRGGFSDTRGTLFFDIARIAREKQPRLLLLENVKGLLSHDKGRTFYTIISTLDELGYDCQWQVLNSKNFGVPQNRERVFIIGHLRGTSRPEVFPFGETDKGNTKQTKEFREQNSNTLRTNYGGATSNETYIAEIKVVGKLDNETWRKRHESIRRVYGTDGIAPTVPTGTGGGVMPKILSKTIRAGGRKSPHGSKQNWGRAILSPKRTEYGKEIRKDYEAGKIKEQRKNIQKLEPRKDDVTNTLTGVQKDNMLMDNSKIRRLTPTECERLQGFPDGWTKSISDTQRYKTLGNAVTVNVIKEIAEKLL